MFVFGSRRTTDAEQNENNIMKIDDDSSNMRARVIMTVDGGEMMIALFLFRFENTVYPAFVLHFFLRSFVDSKQNREQQNYIK